MAEDPRDNYYDFIILGTGLVESVLSCSLAKKGKRVLHIDQNDYYGEMFASFNLSNCMKYFHQIADQPSAEGEISHGSNVKLSPRSDASVAFENAIPNFLLIPAADPIEGAKVNQEVKLYQFYKSYFTKYIPANKKSSYMHPAFFSYLERNPKTKSSSAPVIPNVECSHPAYYPLFHLAKDTASSTRETAINEEERFLSLLIHYDRYFNIDLAPKLIYCSGQLINALVHSQVSNYLEFKPMNSLYYFLSSSEEMNKKSKNNDLSYQIWKVPSNKNDIFLSKHLTAIEKRLLMKFYQYIFDYSQVIKGNANVLSLNENELMSGRALYRPQNKSSGVNHATTDTNNDGSEAVTDAKGNNAILNGDIIYNGENYKAKSFDEFLNAFKLSEKLKNIVIYSLCFHYMSSSSPVSKSEEFTTVLNEVKNKSIHTCLKDLSYYFNSMGIFGENAFLAPFYGFSEMIQGFYRMSAVWGTTFILRQSIQSAEQVNDPPKNEETPGKEVVETTETVEITTQALSNELKESKTNEDEPKVISDEENGNNEDEEGEKGKERKQIIIPQTYLSVKDQDGKEHKCSKLISNFIYSPAASCAPYFSFHYVLILSSPCFFFQDERSFGILPPHFQYNTNSLPGEKAVLVSLNNPCTIYFHQSDHSTEASPEGFHLLHIHSLIEDNTVMNAASSSENSHLPLNEWTKRAQNAMEEAQKLVKNLKQLILLKNNNNTSQSSSSSSSSSLKIQFIDENPLKSSSTASLSSSTNLEILFARAFLRPVAQESWSRDNSNPNIYYTTSFDYSNLHLENEVLAAKQLLNELLMEEKVKAAAAAERKNQEGGEEQELVEEMKDLNLFDAEKVVNPDLEEETQEANEYVNLYEKTVSATTEKQADKEVTQQEEVAKLGSTSTAEVVPLVEQEKN
jgi:RAB protein geranylgeranyltransferase component A